MPGWAWMVIGVLATLLLLAGLVLTGKVSAPRFMSGDGDGFFRPQPNPDAQPAPVDAEGEAIVPEGVADETDPSRGREAASTRKPDAEDADYDFYTLLPGKEVPMTEAEIAATAQAESRRAEQARAAQLAAASTSGTTAQGTLPAPVRDETTTRPAASTTAATATAPQPTTSTLPEPTRPAAAAPAATPAIASATPPAPIGTDTRYLLQAGAFQASGQAEELKAKIALLGLGARVESAQIKGNTVYRVRMGPYGTASDLSDAKRKLAAGGVPGMAIKVD